MPAQRAPGQKQVLTMFDEKFLKEIEVAMRRAGYSDRSKFIRDAVFEKLQQLGIQVKYEVAMAPRRAPRVTQVHHGTGDNHYNEAPAATPSAKETPPAKKQTQSQSQAKAKAKPKKKP